MTYLEQVRSSELWHPYVGLRSSVRFIRLSTASPNAHLGTESMNEFPKTHLLDYSIPSLSHFSPIQMINYVELKKGDQY